MSQLTRIGFGSLQSGPGSVTLPEQVTLECPQCGAEVADKGQCIVNFEVVPDDTVKTGFSLEVLVDCRNCGCQMKKPAVRL